MDQRSDAPRIYLTIFVLLVVLTLATVGLSFLELGRWHLLVGMAIGAMKASLVGLFFMHLIQSSSRTWLAAGIGVFWLGIMITLTMSDYLTRALASY
jgi:cytochrome c oxidase subunit 4